MTQTLKLAGTYSLFGTGMAVLWRDSYDPTQYWSWGAVSVGFYLLAIYTLAMRS